MGKATVENSLRLDAHFWASDVIRQAARQLARRLAAAQRGEDASTSGLIKMSWTRGGTTPAGHIQWGILSEEGGQIKELLLLNIRGSQQHPRRQAVVLDWTTSAGKPSRLPVLHCPFCRRRCRYLFAVSHQTDLVRKGEFACRLCANLCYAQQLKYQSVWSQSLDSVFSLWKQSLTHPERLKEKDLVRAESAAAAFERLSSRLINSLPLPADTPPARAKERQLEDTNAQQEDKEQPIGAMIPDILPTKRRGRPSPKRERQEARAAAKLLREAQLAAAPKRPVGRPRTRRPYVTKTRTTSGCAGCLAADEGYCVGCRARRQLVNAAPFLASNGRPGIKGQCAKCGRGLCRMGRDNQADITGGGATTDRSAAGRCFS